MVHGTTSAAAATRLEPPQSASHEANMADAVEMFETEISAQSAATASIIPEDQYSGLAQAVAALVSPTITSAVDRAIAVGITQLGKEQGDHPKRLSELEHRMSDLEDEIQIYIHLSNIRDTHTAIHPGQTGRS